MGLDFLAAGPGFDLAGSGAGFLAAFSGAGRRLGRGLGCGGLGAGRRLRALSCSLQLHVVANLPEFAAGALGVTCHAGVVSEFLE